MTISADITITEAEAELFRRRESRQEQRGRLSGERDTAKREAARLAEEIAGANRRAGLDDQPVDVSALRRRQRAAEERAEDLAHQIGAVESAIALIDEEAAQLRQNRQPELVALAQQASAAAAEQLATAIDANRDAIDARHAAVAAWSKALAGDEDAAALRAPHSDPTRPGRSYADHVEIRTQPHTLQRRGSGPRYDAYAVLAELCDRLAGYDVLPLAKLDAAAISEHGRPGVYEDRALGVRYVLGSADIRDSLHTANLRMTAHGMSRYRRVSGLPAGYIEQQPSGTLVVDHAEQTPHGIGRGVVLDRDDGPRPFLIETNL